MTSPDGAATHLALHVDRLADGRYELGAVLGSGGMGVVRRARDRSLDREVAVKLLADNLAADPVARERFLREARAAARISDPHVVAVHDVGEDSGRPYLVMELVEGESLARAPDAPPLSHDEVARIADDALAGLAATHEAGILHRDIKPANLLRGHDGRVRLADLGVAEAAEDPALTRTGFVIGSRPYLAPERRRGGPASVATDLYALGAALAELLGGSVVEGVPRVPAASGGAAITALLHALLADDPADRPADATTARRLLRRSAAGDGEPTAELTATRTVAARTSARGVPWWGALVAALAIVALWLVLAPVTGPTVGRAGEDGVAGQPTSVDAPGDPGDGPATRARELASWLRDQAD